MAQLDENSFRTVSVFKGYSDKAEITNLNPQYLVPGSQNVLIDYGSRVISRPGYILFGQANNGGSGIRSSYEWVTSTGSEFPIRGHDGMLEFYWNDTWNLLQSGYATSDFSFAKVLDTTEQIDVLKFVMGDANTYKWSGGVTKVASSSNATGIISGVTSPIVSNGGSGYMLGDILTISGATGGQVRVTGLSTNSSVSTIGITAGNAGGGYVVGDTIIIQSTIFGLNGVNPTARVTSVATNGAITGLELVNAGSYNLVGTGYPTIGGSGVYAQVDILTVTSTAVTAVVITSGGSGYSIGTGNATTGGNGTGAKIDITSIASNSITKQGVLTNKTTIAFNAGTPGSIAPTITDSANGFLTAGFAEGDTLNVNGVTPNSRTFTVAGVTAGTITLVMSDVLITEVSGTPITLDNGDATWSDARFLTTGTRSFVYNGVEYQYSGGEDTDTLIGLSAVPPVNNGDPVWQSIIVTPNPLSIAYDFYADLIGYQNNQMILASTQDRRIYISSDTDYTNFTLTDPRVPGGPAFVDTLDDYCTCLVPLDNIAQTTSSLILGRGKNGFSQLSYQLDSVNETELARIIQFKTANGSGLISKGAICSIKNSTAYISREPALDTIANIQNTDDKDVPLSDLIKNSFDKYDFTGAHLMYWKRAIYIALPEEGLVLIYDLMRKLWQPPWTMPISRLAVIDDWLYGHSSVNNETYKLYTGTNDNGNFIPQVARFAYNNNGNRSRLKHMTEYWSDGYITPGAQLTMNTYFGFLGDGSKTLNPIVMPISASNSPATGSPLGTESIGSLDGLPNENDSPLNGLVRFYAIDTSAMVDYLEMFVEYKMNVLDRQFAIVSHGSNAEDSETSPVQYKN